MVVKSRLSGTPPKRPLAQGASVCHWGQVRQRGRWRGATDRSPVPVPGSQRVVQGSVRRWAAWNAPGVPWAIFGGSKEVASVTGA
jgi:hypothetical protein